MNKTLSKHASGALDYLIHGPGLARAYQELDKSQWLPRETILHEQWNRVQRILGHAYAKVPRYREVMENAGLSPQDIQSPDDFLRVPILTKDSLRANIERMVDPDADRAQLRKGATGGSTGEPTPYYQGSLYSKYTGAATFRNMHWTGWDFGDRIVQLWGSPFDVGVGQSLRGRINRLARNTRVVPAFDMGKPAMQDYLSEIAVFRPELIIGYVDALYLLACYILEQGSTRLKPKPRAVISAAGTLYDYQRLAIETAFGCKVFNRYGGREMGDIAHECEAGQGLHINEETVYVEVIRDGQPCPPGVEGELIITSLTNFDMPMIRYAVGDRGVLAEPGLVCSCGRGLPLLTSVTGRVQDVIVTPAGKYI
jgi:phenylacetate-CoA ligase